MIEITFGTFFAEALLEKFTSFPVLSEVHEGAVLFLAGPALEIPADFAAIHKWKIIIIVDEDMSL